MAFYNHRGMAEQHIKEGKNAIRWTRLSCRKFRNNEVRLQLHALAYNLGNFMPMLASPKEVEHWLLTTLREKLVKIGAKVVRHGRYVAFQMADVAMPKRLFVEILRLIAELRLPPDPTPARAAWQSCGRVTTTREVRPDGGEIDNARRTVVHFGSARAALAWRLALSLAGTAEMVQSDCQILVHPGNVG